MQEWCIVTGKRHRCTPGKPNTRKDAIVWMPAKGGSKQRCEEVLQTQGKGGLDVEEVWVSIGDPQERKEDKQPHSNLGYQVRLRECPRSSV